MKKNTHILFALASLLTWSSRNLPLDIINMTDTSFERAQITTKSGRVLRTGKLDARSYLPLSSIYYRAITKDLPLTLTLHKNGTARNLLIDHTPKTGDTVEFSDRWVVYRDAEHILQIMEINKQRS